MNEARAAVLDYFNADPDHFDVVFTANATAAIKLVADCFRDQGFWYGYHKDTHSSIVGVREIANAGTRCFTSNEDVDMWINEQSATSTHSGLKLFAYPAQSNMTGYRPPLSWSKRVRDAHPGARQTAYVLLDAASYLTSGRLDLSEVDDAPDFIAMSFYKMFGYPDLGALLVRKSAFGVMSHRRYFGGGTVDMVTVIDSAFRSTKKQSLHDFLEDGTLPFHNIVALKHAITVHKKIFGSVENISKHTAQLSGWLYEQMRNLKHTNNTPVIDLYKDKNATYGNPKTQGPIISFSVLGSDGTFIGKSHFERLAIACGFQIRTGGVCNPGGIASMLNLSHWELRRNFTEGVRCGDDIDIVGDKPTGIIRVSLGPMSTMSDAARFVEFVKHFFIETTTPKSPKHKGVPPSPSITPIEGCSSITLPNIKPAAYKVWDNQWCIVDPKSKTPIDHRALASLTTTIDLRTEHLVITHEPTQRKLRISLWIIPAEQQPYTTRALDTYNAQDIKTWLSTYLNTPSTLARYRHANAHHNPTMTTCILPTCAAQHTTTAALKLHYKSHAQIFLQKHPFFNNDIKNNNNEQQPRPKTWRINTHAFSSSTINLSRPRHTNSPSPTPQSAKQLPNNNPTQFASITLSYSSDESTEQHHHDYAAHPHDRSASERLKEKQKQIFKVLTRVFDR